MRDLTKCKHPVVSCEETEFISSSSHPLHHLQRMMLPSDARPSQNPVTTPSTEPIIPTPAATAVLNPSLSPTTPITIPPSKANEQENTSSRHTEVRRSQRLRRLPTHLKDFVLK